MGEARSVMVVGRREKHLRFVLHTAERLGMHNAVSVALERGSDGAFIFGNRPSL